MNLATRILGITTAAGFAAALSLPAAAQTSPNVPSNVTVPNTGTTIKCNANGTATVTQNPNATQSTEQTVPGTPVTQNNPNGPGTTTTQTPTLQKPTTNVATQCPKTTPTTTAPMTNTEPQSTMPAGNGPAGSEMNALTNNPNGSNWTDKFNRPMISSSHMGSVKTKHKHRKRATGGGGH